ncbi:MAG TPA: hypothetical protein VJK07_00900 [Candidatus Nanoarchaeia archaeon]|nr:hypothetical protein [Candidatus Nanoarchaeia archaeon]
MAMVYAILPKKDDTSLRLAKEIERQWQYDLQSHQVVEGGFS